MDHEHLRMVADTCQGVFAEALLHACGKETRLCRRERLMTPLRVGLAVVATSARHQVDPVADVHRGFWAFVDVTVSSKALYDQLATPRCADGMRTMTARLVGERTLNGFGYTTGQACAACRHLVIHAGTSWAMHDAFRAVCPGRCNAVKPAAVARHPTLALRCEAPTPVVFTPETTRAQALLPAPKTRTGRLLWAARGDGDRGDLRRVDTHGGAGIFRANAGMHPQGVEAFRAAGTRLRSWRTQPRKAIHATRPQRQRVARLVAWQGKQRALRLRLRISGHRQTQACCSWVPTLPAQRSRLAMLSRASTWRWHVA